jgi:hypothetical protein
MRRVWALIFALVAMFGSQAQPSVGESYFVIAEVVPSKAFVGQQLSYVVTAYSDTVRDVTLTPPAFSGLYQGEIRSIGSSATVNDKQYNVVTFAITIYPSRSGEITIPSVEVIFEGTVLDAPQTAITHPVRLTVNSPPSVDSFSGLIGRHTATFTLDVTSVELGQPITAEYRVRGTGYVSGLPVPALIVPDIWRAYLDPSQVVHSSEGMVTITEKVFRWRLIPDRAGVLSVGAAPLMVYDLVTGAYLPLTVDPVEVQVLASANGETVRASAIAALENSSLELPAATDSAVLPPPNLSWILAPLGTVVVIILQAIHRRVRATQRELRRKNALSTAKMRLTKVSKLTGESALKAIESAAAGYLRDKEISETPALREALVLVESVRYAPQIEDVAGLASTVYAALSQAESESEL